MQNPYNPFYQRFRERHPHKKDLDELTHKETSEPALNLQNHSEWPTPSESKNLKQVASKNKQERYDNQVS